MTDRSILRRLEEHGYQAPRVRLKGADEATASEDRYQVLGEVARGGVGVVYRGRDSDLGRDVALKVLHARHLGNPGLVERFIEEAQVGGQLQHPGIVPVYELGLRADKRPFFAMKLIKGQTLAARLAARDRPAAERHALLAVFREVCRTVAYAHSRGVIHRDLKPSNVMIGPFGEVQVVDWGFAKVLGRGGVADERLLQKAERDRTMISTVRSGEGESDSLAGSVMGTPAYMPPEQALGRVDDLDERSDAFSLGAILCEILTGAPPYTGSERDRLTAAAQARLEDAYARLAASGADAALVETCRACLQPLPQDRPASADVLAERIAAHLAHVEGRAHRAELRALEAAAHAEAQVRARHRVVIAGVGGIAVLLAALGAWLLLDGARRQREGDRQRSIGMALQEAERLRGAQRWPEALASAERARALGYDGSITDAIRTEAAEAAARAERAARTRSLLAELEQARQMRVEQGGYGPDRIEIRNGASTITYAGLATTDQRYRALLEQHGLDLDGPAEEIAQGLRSRFPDALAALAGYLDEWAFRQRVRRRAGQSGGTDPALLMDVGQRIAPESDRAALHAAWASGEDDALRALGEEGALVGKSAGYLQALTMSLSELGDTGPSQRAREAAVRAYPHDAYFRLALAGWSRLTGAGGAAEALRHATLAVALRPSSYAWKELGEARQAAGDWEGAARALRESLRLEPGLSEARFALGRVELGLGRREQALAVFRAAAEGDDASAKPSDPEALGTAISWLKRLGEPPERLLPLAERAVDLGRTLPWPRIVLAGVLTRLDRPEQAREALQEGLALCGDDTSVLGEYAMTLHGWGYSAQALEVFDRALALDPGDRANLGDRAIVLAALGRAEEAEAASRALIALAEDAWGAHFGLACNLTQRGQLPEAEAAIGQAQRFEPRRLDKRAVIRQQRSLILLRMGRSVEAEAAAREALALNPPSFSAHETLATCLGEMGRWEEAADVLRAGLDGVPPVGDPAWPAAEVLARMFGAMGAYSHRLGRLPEAVQATERALEFAPRDDLLRRNAVVLYTSLMQQRLQAEDFEGALASARGACRWDPSPGTYGNLSLVLSMMGREDAAVEAALDAVRGAPIPGDPAVPKAGVFANVFVTLSHLQLQAGRTAEAVAAAERGLEFAPGNAQLLTNLGVSRLCLGDLTGALAATRMAVRLLPERTDQGTFLVNLLGHQCCAVQGEELRKIEDERVALAEKLWRRAPEDLETWRLGVLLDAGRYPEVLAAAERALDRSMEAAQRAQLEGMLAEARAKAAAKAGLAAWISGEAQPANARERLAFAFVLEHDRPDLAVRAARECEQALREEPGLLHDGDRDYTLDAATLVLVAGLSAGEEADVGDVERARWRAKALEWFRLGLGRSDRSASLEQKQSYLAHLRVCAKAAPVREEAGLAGLPEAERETWRAFWKDAEDAWVAVTEGR